MTRRDFLKDTVAFGFAALAGLLPCAAGARADRLPSAVKVVQWNIGHFAHGLDKRTAIAAEDSAAQSAEYRAMIGRLKPDFLGVSEFDPVFDNEEMIS